MQTVYPFTPDKRRLRERIDERSRFVSEPPSEWAVVAEKFGIRKVAAEIIQLHNMVEEALIKIPEKAALLYQRAKASWQKRKKEKQRKQRALRKLKRDQKIATENFEEGARHSREDFPASFRSFRNRRRPSSAGRRTSLAESKYWQEPNRRPFGAFRRPSHAKTLTPGRDRRHSSLASRQADFARRSLAERSHSTPRRSKLEHPSSPRQPSFLRRRSKLRRFDEEVEAEQIDETASKQTLDEEFQRGQVDASLVEYGSVSSQERFGVSSPEKSVTRLSEQQSSAILRQQSSSLLSQDQPSKELYEGGSREEFAELDEIGASPMSFNEQYQDQLTDEDLHEQLVDEDYPAQLEDEEYQAKMEDEEYQEQFEDEDYQEQLEDEEYQAQLEDEEYQAQLADEEYQAQFEDDEYQAQFEGEDYQGWENMEEELSLDTESEQPQALTNHDFRSQDTLAGELLDAKLQSNQQSLASLTEPRTIAYAKRFPDDDILSSGESIYEGVSRAKSRSKFAAEDLSLDSEVERKMIQNVLPNKQISKKSQNTATYESDSWRSQIVLSEDQSAASVFIGDRSSRGLFAEEFSSPATTRYNSSIDRKGSFRSHLGPRRFHSPAMLSKDRSSQSSKATRGHSWDQYSPSRSSSDKVSQYSFSRNKRGRSQNRLSPVFREGQRSVSVSEDRASSTSTFRDRHRRTSQYNDRMSPGRQSKIQSRSSLRSNRFRPDTISKYRGSIASSYSDRSSSGRPSKNQSKRTLFQHGQLGPKRYQNQASRSGSTFSQENAYERESSVEVEDGEWNVGSADEFVLNTVARKQLSRLSELSEELSVDALEDADPSRLSLRNDQPSQFPSAVYRNNRGRTSDIPLSQDDFNEARSSRERFTEVPEGRRSLHAYQQVEGVSQLSSEVSEFVNLDSLRKQIENQQSQANFASRTHRNDVTNVAESYDESQTAVEEDLSLDSEADYRFVRSKFLNRDLNRSKIGQMRSDTSFLPTDGSFLPAADSEFASQGAATSAESSRRQEPLSLSSTSLSITSR